jgi:N-acetylglucosaminyl-diphospho-decaprenol L-rhamnosyltransferase
MTDLAVIIVSYNVRDLLAQTLRSLQASLATSDLQTRILVVDNLSQDDSAAMVRTEFPNVELLEPGTNLGFAGGNNFALRHLGFGKGQHGSAEWVWLLNPDTEVVGDTPQRLVAHGREQTRVGALGPRLQYGNGTFQHGAFGFPGLAQVAFDLFPVPGRLLESPLNGRYPASAWAGDQPFRVEMLLGAALMVRGATISDVGLMDEGYFMYVEELDWCRQMHEAGWWLHAVPTATVIHHSGQSTQQFRERMFVALWKSRLRYYDKWESPFYRRAVRALLRLGMRWQSRAAKGGGEAIRLAAYHEVSAL